VGLDEQPDLDDVGELITAFLGAGMKVLVIAPADVAEQALVLLGRVRDTLRTIEELGYEGPPYNTAASLWIKARRALVDLIRGDVAADLAPIGGWPEPHEDWGGIEPA
jgi:hypothetical protein